MAASLYEVLGIPMGASLEEIKGAYRRLARACHPDVVAMERKERSADEFIKIHAAYSTLLDPEKRLDYDRTLFMRRRHRGSAFNPTTFSAYTCRGSWETDQCW